MSCQWEIVDESYYHLGELVKQQSFVAYSCLLKLRVYLGSDGIWHGQIWENSERGPNLGMFTESSKEKAQEVTKNRAIELVSITLERLSNLR